jgi:hypothetical protein
MQCLADKSSIKFRATWIKYILAGIYCNAAKRRLKTLALQR